MFTFRSGRSKCICSLGLVAVGHLIIRHKTKFLLSTRNDGWLKNRILHTDVPQQQHRSIIKNELKVNDQLVGIGGKGRVNVGCVWCVTEPVGVMGILFLVFF